MKLRFDKDLWKECGIDYHRRAIYLTGDIDSQTLERVILARDLFKASDAAVMVYIHTAGGDLYSMLGIIDVLREAPFYVQTKCIGAAFSAGLYILLAGCRRTMSPYSYVFFHDLQIEFSGDFVKLQKDAAHLKHVETIIQDLVESKTKISWQKYKAWCKTTKYLVAQEALEWGIIDEIEV